MKLQQDDYSCGPVAIINAYFYQQKKYPPISTNKLKHECITNEVYGTHRWDMTNNSILSLAKPVYDINKIIQMDAFILLYSFDRYAHYAFVEKDFQNNQYILYNHFDLKNDQYSHDSIQETEFTQKILKNNPKKDELDFPVAWKISKSIVC